MKHTKLTAALLSALCASALSLNPTAGASAAETVQLMGDLNKDMLIGVDDAQNALTIYVSGITGSDTSANAENGAADINMNGEIDIDDASNILTYYCQTLVGGQPLWADIRSISYADGSDYYSYYLTDEETGALVLDDEGQPILIKPHADSPFTLKGLYLEIGCASGAPGETVEIPVYVAGLPALAGFQLLVEHDPALTLTKITTEIGQYPELKNLSENMDTNPSFDSTHGCIVAAQADNCTFTDGCVLCKYHYTIPKDAKSGDVYTMTVDSSYTNFITKDCVGYQYTMLGGAITVQ